MSDNVYSRKKIAKNTMTLYIQMSLSIVVQFYVIPVLLETLGVAEYGIYNAIAGVVTLFTFISGSLASATQRFMAFGIGKNDSLSLKEIFSTTLLVYVALSIFFVFLFETIGVYFVNSYMQFPTDRIDAVNWVFQITIFSFAFEFLFVPFRAAMIAHEKINVLAFLSILDYILRLLVALSLKYIEFDRIIAYSILLFSENLLIVVLHIYYCKYKFDECCLLSLRWNRKIGKSILSYSGWNMLGSLAMISRSQGVNVIQNVFFGPLINAAHSIAQQVYALVFRLVDNVYVSSRPQIIKLYAAGRIEEMWELIFQSAKFAFFLMMLLCIPALLELNQILELWLHEVPLYTESIAKLLIYSLLLETLVNQTVTSFQAANKIKKYQITSSVFLLLNIPCSFMILKYYEQDPLWPYYISILLSFLYLLSILWNAKIIVNLDLRKYIKVVIFRNLLVFGLSFLITYFLRNLLAPSIFRLFYTTTVSLLISIVLIWFIGISDEERRVLLSVIRDRLNCRK